MFYLFSFGLEILNASNFTNKKYPQVEKSSETKCFKTFNHLQKSNALTVWINSPQVLLSPWKPCKLQLSNVDEVEVIKNMEKSKHILQHSCLSMLIAILRGATGHKLGVIIQSSITFYALQIVLPLG